MSAHLDEMLWWVVCQRWRSVGVPREVMLCLDSTVVVRYGTKQAGAEKGYNPKKPGRPSHHPLVAFLGNTGDCLGVRWRPGSASAAAGAIPWLRLLVERLRSAGVEQITVRLDKGFWSRAMVEALEDLQVSYLLKVPDHAWVRGLLGPRRRSRKDPRLWTATGPMWGARLMSIEERVSVTELDQLELGTYTIKKRAHVLTNIEDIHAVTAWRSYNAGTAVEHRIEELTQLGVGRTSIDHIGGNALLWSLGALAYELIHFVRTTALQGSWRSAQPARLRAFLIRLPARITTHSRKWYLQLVRGEPLRPIFLRALRIVGNTGPPIPA